LDSATIAFAQTYDNVPVWRTGISVTIRREPSRIIESTNTTLPNVDAELGTARNDDAETRPSHRGSGCRPTNHECDGGEMVSLSLSGLFGLPPARQFSLCGNA
jgi:hypothetical protein